MNKNYCEKGCVTSTNDVDDVLLAQIRQEIKELLNTTEAKLLCQSKKIDATVVYIKNNLSTAITDLLSSMENSGELDEIIVNAVTDFTYRFNDLKTYLDTKTLHLDYNRIFRHMAESRGNRIANDERNYKCAFGQGIASTPTSIIFGETCNYNYNNNGHFVEFNKSTGEITREWDLENVGHISALAYNCSTNEFYVLPFWYNSNGTSTRTNELKIYDYNSMTLKKTVVLTVNVAGFNVDNSTGLMYGATGSEVYSINPKTYAMRKLFSYESLGGIQGIAMYEGYMYINLFNATYILKTDLEGNVVATMPIERYYGIYYTGEPEGITIDDNGDIYMLSCAYNPYSFYFCNQVFKSNVKSNTGIKDTRSGNCQSLSNFYVGNPTSNNPDGTSANPFGTICEVLLSFNSPTAKSVGLNRIDLQKNCPDETFYYRGGDIIIMGGNYKICQLWLSDCNVYINALNVENQEDCQMSHNVYMARCTGTIYSITSTQRYGICNINLEFCWIRIVSATCNGTPTEGRIRTNGGNVMGSSKATNEIIYGNGQQLQKTTTLFSANAYFDVTNEQIYQLGNVFTNLQMFCQLTVGEKNYYSGINAKLTGSEMQQIRETGTLTKDISCTFTTDISVVNIACKLVLINKQFRLQNFTSFTINENSVTKSTGQFIVLAMTLN